MFFKDHAKITTRQKRSFFGREQRIRVEDQDRPIFLHIPPKDYVRQFKSRVKYLHESRWIFYAEPSFVYHSMLILLLLFCVFFRLFSSRYPANIGKFRGHVPAETVTSGYYRWSQGTSR